MKYEIRKERLLLSIFWRSFYLQGVWNFERLQNVGFLYGMLPLLRALYTDPEERRQALLRHVGFFNTHPYMVNIIYGLVAATEEEIREGKQPRADVVNTLKNNLAGPLAAIGDTFFWATWRPFVAMLAASLVLFFNDSGGFAGTWLAPVFFVVIYNVLHIPFRYWTLRVSYRIRTKIIEIIADLEFQFVVKIVRGTGAVFLSIVALYYLWMFAEGTAERVVFLAGFAAAVVAGTRRVSPLSLFYSTVLFGILFALIRGY